MPAERLEAEIVTLAGRIAAATSQWLQLVAEFDRRESYAAWGCTSTAHWLAWQAGLGLRAGYDHVRVARALRALPRVRTEFAAGRLSFSKVRALCRVATPVNEAALVDIARCCTASQLERLTAGYAASRAVAEAERAAAAGDGRPDLAPPDGPPAERLTAAWGDDGMLELRVRVRLRPDQGAAVLAALAAARAPDDGPGGPADAAGDVYRSHRDRPARDAEALGRLAETFLAQGPRPSNDRHLVLVHLDAAVDADAAVPSGHGPEPAPDRSAAVRRALGGWQHLDDGPQLARPVLDRILCTASRVRVVDGPDGGPLDVGRKTRAIPPAISRALRSRDGGCRFPGCSERLWVDAHHIRPWSVGGPTSLANLVLLCRHHHTCLHEGGFGLVVTEAGQLRWHAPAGWLIPDAPTAPTIPSASAGLAEQPPGDVAGDWDGTRLDLDHALWCLGSRDERPGIDGAGATESTGGTDDAP